MANENEIDRQTPAALAAATRATGGLTSAEAERLLAQFGPNELPQPHVNTLLQLLSNFWGPIPWMIEAALVLSAVIRDVADFTIILVLLLANAGVRFWEERQAGNAVAALRARLAPEARAMRDGTWQSIPARLLVPGDLVHVRIGDIVPADAELLSDDPLEVDQSALTGESLPATVERDGTLYSGSVVRRGEGDAAVAATGGRTYFGTTARLVEEAGGRSHFQQAVVRIGDFLIAVALVLVVVILVVATLRGNDVLETVQFTLVLTVAAVPVALPAVLSVTMAVGARSLAGMQAVVTRLPAIEELAGVDVLCVDKTGTLTQNRLTLGDPAPMEGVSTQDLLLAAALASRAEDADPIDAAILEAVEDGAAAEFRVTRFHPFDPVSKHTEASVSDPGGATFEVAKGAPQVILEMSDDADSVREQAMRTVDEFAARGYRSLGVARADARGHWRFLGLLPLYDPPREDAGETVRSAQELGIDVRMLTGDQLAIAREVAEQVGLGARIIEASAIEQADDSAIPALINEADGFAQVFPEHKFRIVQAMQAQGHIVGMTGDGVNDAPALKQAEAGIAVSGATDSARAAADIVLLAPGISTIVQAVLQGRLIFRRMTNYAIYRIAETLRVLLFMTLAILVFDFFPVTPRMIVLLALLNDGAILSIAYDRVKQSDQPERWDMRTVLAVASVLGALGVVATFGLFALGELVWDLDRDTIRTLIYLKLSVAGHLTVFVARTRGPFWSERPAKVLLAAVVGTQALATFVAVFGLLMTPIGVGWAVVVWVYALAWFPVNDAVKRITYRVLSAGESDSTAGEQLASAVGPSGR